MKFGWIVKENYEVLLNTFLFVFENEGRISVVIDRMEGIYEL